MDFIKREYEIMGIPLKITNFSNFYTKWGSFHKMRITESKMLLEVFLKRKGLRRDEEVLLLLSNNLLLLTSFAKLQTESNYQSN